MALDPTANAALDPNGVDPQVARLSPFAYNPAYATPQQKEYLRRMALTLQKPGEAKSWAQVFGNMAQTAVGAMLANRATDIEQGQQAAIERTSQGWGSQPDAGGSQGGAPLQGSGMLGTPPPSGNTADSSLPAVSQQYGPAIAHMESGGRYDSLGPITKTGDRARGKYGVMGANVPSWTAEAMGQPMTPEQFSASPAAQEAVFSKKFGQYLQKTGNVRDAASMWFTGKTLAQGGGARKDQLGTSGSSYANQVAAMLMKGPGGGGGGGGGATAYADAGGSQGGGGPQWPAERPQTIGGLSQRAPGPVMAQNAVPGGPPVQGSPEYARIMAIPGHPAQESILRQQQPIVTQDALGANKMTRPAMTPTGAELQPGYAQPNFNVTSGGVGGNTVVPVRNGQAGPPVAGPVNAGDLTSLAKAAAPAQEVLQGTAAKGAELEGKAADVGVYRREGQAASAKLGQIETLKALGDQVDTGVTPMFQNFASKFGVHIGEDTQLGRTTAYAAMAGALLPSFGLDQQADAFRERLPALSATKEGRRIIADFLGNYLAFQKKRGEIAGGGGSIEDRIDRIGKLDSPKMEFRQVPAGGAPAPGGAQAAEGGAGSLPAPKTPEEYAAIKKGVRYQHPDDPPGHYRTKK